MKFSLSERYRLELHWKKVLRPKAGTMHLTGACFTGPAMKHAEKINDDDFITVDFCSQLIILTKSVYVARLSWGEVIYVDDTVKLKNVQLNFDPELKGIPSLKDEDYLVIDTKNHERQTHALHLVYPAYVVDGDSELYDYRR